MNEKAAELKRKMRGRIRKDEPLARHTSFRIGGPARVWAEPADEKDLRAMLGFAKKNKMTVLVIGAGSNILASDRGFDGMAIRLNAPAFRKLTVSGRTITAGAGCGMAAVVRTACSKGLAGLESLVGIPGTVGGAVYMNAGGSANPIFRNIGDFVDSVRVMDRSGRVKALKRADIKFGYRNSGLDGYVVLGARLKLSKGRAADLSASAGKFLAMKREKQVLDIPSAGCVFKNPAGFQFTCGQMIDMLGLKGTRSGGAEISDKHANFIVNRDGATAEDVKKLIDVVRRRVKENYNLALELEIKVL